jgi:hypothetical protein
MKWEYKTIKMQAAGFLEGEPSFESPAIDRFINNLGQEGWELVSTQGIIATLTPEVHIKTKAIVLFFKRPLAA